MSKNRLTITLSQDLLNKVDQLIDKRTIRNRSHAIEYLVTKSLRPSVTTAVILAGNNTPENVRPLTEVQGQPLILHTVHQLRDHGVRRVIITTDHAGKSIEKLLGNGAHFNIEINYVYEASPLGTAGAIKNIHHLIKDQAFFVLSGDIFTDINLDDLASFHYQHQPVVTIAVKPRATKSSYDNVFLQGPRVVAFQASTKDQEVSVVNAGVYVFSPEIFAHIHKSPSMLEKDVFPTLTQANKCVAFMFQGVWFDVSTDQHTITAVTK